MLNPDGVINGNTRCSLAGVDLNRVWSDPSRKIHPTIYHTKMMIKKFSEDRDIFLYCDFHGHSRKKNVFMYGCSGKNNDRLRERIFPCLFHKNSSIFSFADSSFGIQKAKESTARVVMWKEYNIINSYTLEASFCGPDFGKFADYHLNTDLLQEVGHTFCQTICDFCDPDQIKVKNILQELEILYPKKDEESDDNDSNADSDFSGDEAFKKKKKKKGQKKKSKKEDKPNGAAGAGVPPSSSAAAAGPTSGGGVINGNGDKSALPDGPRATKKKS
jgi:cytosolic carboxypeptidase protein 2/3